MPQPRSGLRIHYRIENSDGSVIDVTTALIDVLRWEKDHGGQAWLEQPLPLERQLWVAWAAGKRAGLVTGIDQAGWAAQVVDIEVITPEEEAAEAEAAEMDPTRTAPSGS